MFNYKNLLNYRWCFDVGPENSKICKIYFNNTFIASGKGKTTKLSKENAAISAISKLRENYFAVKVSNDFDCHYAKKRFYDLSKNILFSQLHVLIKIFRSNINFFLIK